MRRRRGRGLDPQDMALWERVAATVQPLRPVQRPVPARPAPAEPEPEPPAPPRPATAPPYSPPVSTPAAARPSPLDRKLKRRLDRGQRRAEAVIDLHGLTQQVAHDRLLGFLRQSQAQGLRVVLVVTGKGSTRRGPGDWWEPPTGILRRSVPHWLETPPFRDLVSAWERPVHRMGGEGALYVQIRRRG